MNRSFCLVEYWLGAAIALDRGGEPGDTVMDYACHCPCNVYERVCLSFPAHSNLA